MPILGLQSSSLKISSYGTINPLVTYKIRKHILTYGFSDAFQDETVDYISSHFDLLIVDQTTNDPERLSMIKAKNPDIIILLYREIMTIHTYDEDWEEVNAHEDWFVHDINGNRLVNEHWDWYAMDVGNTGWRTHYANFFINKLDMIPQLDGIFADDVWDQLYTNRWTVPDDRIPTDVVSRFHNDMLEMIEFVKQTIGEKLLIVNVCMDACDDYVDVSDGKMDEGFVHPAWYPADEFWYDWKTKVDALSNVSGKGKYYLAQCGVPTGTDYSILHKVMLYCFASYLLGVNGENASFAFNNLYNPSGLGAWLYSEYDDAKKLDRPINDYYLFGSVYSRDFINGKVLVNPTSTSYTVSLEKNYRTLDGQTVSNITLEDHTGIILLSP